MKEVTKKLNKILVFLILTILVIIIFIDNDTLNSLFIDYNDDFNISEITISETTDDKVIYQDTGVTSVANTSNSSTATQLSSTVSNTWAWPTDGGYTITTYYSTSHKALDIYKGYGSNIYAANNGVITSVKAGCIAGNTSCNGRGGNYIVIKHNNSNYYTIYMHLKDIKVKVGDVVSKGQVIGTMGNTGNVEPVPTTSAPYLGTHLHFCLYIGEPYKGGYAVNPMRLY